MKQSFCFILTPLEIEGDLPFEVISRHFFQRADTEQVKLIKQKLALYLDPLVVPPYEFDFVPRNDGGQGVTRRALPEASWRYWVINLTGGNSEIRDLAMAASLLREEIAP